MCLLELPALSIVILNNCVVYLLRFRNSKLSPFINNLFCFFFVYSRRRHKRSKQQARLGTRLWFQTVTTPSLITSPSGSVLVSNNVFIVANSLIFRQRFWLSLLLSSFVLDLSGIYFREVLCYWVGKRIFKNYEHVFQTLFNLFPPSCLCPLSLSLSLSIQIPPLEDLMKQSLW